ncbi:zinc metalloproteinase nas-13-like isoform X2 [Littorina saxatilis]|uniref:zinc metalloproteinase nas-13-like isoform X2 n=1 Tax=Littorina saxatilis TaxID=31220 RepID=UPI0038B5616D
MIPATFNEHRLLSGVLAFFCIQKAICLSIDKLLLQGNHAPNVMEFQFDEASGVYSFDLDLLFTKSQWKRLQDRNQTTTAAGGRGKRKGSLVADLWPNAVVPYEFSKYYEPNEITTVKSAMSNWEEHTCVQFKPATSRDRNKLTFAVSSSCKSFVGMDSAGPQNLYLTEDCRGMEGVITHEVGHVLGLYHEQSRHDRDQYVTINWDNIPEMTRRNFELLTDDVISGYGVPYDYKSIMHYGATAFSPDDEYTIIPKDSRFLNVIGNREELSFRDIKIINAMYKCGKHCGGTCPGEGFHDKNCRCMCPGVPIQLCSQGGREPDAGGQLPPGWKPDAGGSGNKPCIDENSQCQVWADGNQCDENPAFMNKYCRKACGICGNGQKPVQDCKDANSQCEQWAKEWNECEKNPTYMKSYCKKSCGICGGSSNNPVPTQPPCRDVNSNCPSWSSFGYCRNPTNAAFMAANCKKSCNQCGGGGTYADDPTSSCRDSNPSCAIWAGARQCKENPDYMLASCKKSCKACGSASGSGNRFYLSGGYLPGPWYRRYRW